MNFKLKSLIYVVFTLVVTNLLAYSAIAQELNYEVISHGYLNDDIRINSMVILEKDELDRILKEQVHDTKTFSVDLESDTVALIVPDKSSYPDIIVIEDIKKNDQDVINVDYSLKSIPYVPDENEEIKKPYKLIKIFPAGKNNTSVSFKKVENTRPVLFNNSVDNMIKYSNVLEDNREALFLNYLPLDKGNSWTYSYESPVGKGSKTFSIVTYTNGWSIYDSYFGLDNLALRLGRDGHIYVSSDKGNRPFYTQDVILTYPKEPFSTGGLEFKDIIVVSSSKGGKLQFKDIYARDVGLIYHEHRTKDGLSKYSLSNASIRGKKIP